MMRPVGCPRLFFKHIANWYGGACYVVTSPPYRSPSGSISLISTPPPERVPIRTHFSSYSKEKMISATKYEPDRDGQVFYVLPRIKGLEEVMEFLGESFPEVEIAIAHGKVIHCLKRRARSMTTSLSMGKIQNYKAPNHY